MTEHERGQVDTSAAEVYDELFVPALFGRFAERLADLAEVGSSDRVVDVACGTGALTRALRTRTGGPVLGIDINPAMVAVAESRTDDIEYRQADAAALPLDDRSFDVATSQYGLMFYPEPSVGVAEMARVADRGLVAVWDGIERSAGYSAMQDLFRDELGDDAASSLDAPFVLGRTGALEAIISDAGIEDATFASIEGTGRFDSIEQWITTEVRGWTLGDSIGDAQLAELVAAGNDRLSSFATADGCIFGMTTKVATWANP